jgi:hypothetical protein
MHWIICPVTAQNTGHLGTKPKVSGLLTFTFAEQLAGCD